MKIKVHNVDHGQCVVVTSPTGQRLMLDCGRSIKQPFFPSFTYAGQRIDMLMALNLDEDHLEDLPDVWRNCEIGAFYSNPTLSAAHLATMKVQGGMGRGVRHVHGVLCTHGSGGIGDWRNALGGIAWRVFHNVSGRDFSDTNNLSLAVFVSFGGFTILFGGDMETAGWRKLMENPAFRLRLPGVKVFVASHHGRENGCCDELFDILKPDVVIFSDGQKQYGTQETLKWYSSRVKGIPDWTKPAVAPMPSALAGGGLGISHLSNLAALLGQPLRKVLTTRSDGTICIHVEANGSYTFSCERSGSTELGYLTGLAAALQGSGPLATSPLRGAQQPAYNALSQLAGLATPPSVSSPLENAMQRLLGW